MNNESHVSEIMTRNVTTIQHDSSIQEAIHLIRKHKIRHIPVLDGKKVVGILTSTDIDRLTFGGVFDDQDLTDEPILTMLSIPQVMSSNLQTINVSDSIRKAAEIFVDKKYHALVIVDNEEVAGIVTTTDLIRYLLDHVLVN